MSSIKHRVSRTIVRRQADAHTHAHRHRLVDALLQHGHHLLGVAILLANLVVLVVELHDLLDGARQDGHLLGARPERAIEEALELPAAADAENQDIDLKTER